jgi:hypothetical protein
MIIELCLTLLDRKRRGRKGDHFQAYDDYEGETMCYSIAEGGLRCDNHAKEKKDKATEAYESNPSDVNRTRLVEAVNAWHLTTSGLDYLRAEAEKEDDADLKAEKKANYERALRLRASKLKYASEVRQRARNAPGKPGTLKEKLQRAANPETPADMQERLAKDKNEKVRLTLAQSSHNSGILDMLWTDSDPKVLGAIARNEHTDAPALEALFSIANKHPASTTSIRLALAGNANCPSSLHLPLVNSGSSQIRSAVAKKSDVDARTLEAIAEDSSPRTRRDAGMSANGSRKVYVVLGCHDKESFVRSAVAENPAVPQDILEWIATNDPDWHIRETAAQTLVSVQASENTVAVA